MHLDYRGHAADAGVQSTFALRRARLGVEGTLFESYEYKVEADFADTGSTLLRDGYVNLAARDAFQLEFGQFKVPFSQEVLQSSNRLTFVERSSLANLTPDRSPGLMLHGTFREGAVEYAVSAQTGRGLLSTSEAGTPEVFGRLRLRPFPGWAEGFALGGAYGQGRSEDATSFRGRTASRSVTFFSPVPVRGQATRANGEFEWLHGRFALRGEFVQTLQRRDGLGAGGQDLPAVVAKGFSVDTAFVFGGDQQANGAIVPHTVFLEGGLGALQLAFRYENLQLDDRSDPNRSGAYTLGFNWWLSRFVRHQSNFVHERFQHPARTGALNGRSAFTYLGRMQLVF
jgi:phosphate-selective porin OprO/OprP